MSTLKQDIAALTAHLALDHDAESADPDLPAFMAPPEGAVPYYGFQVLEEVDVEGFKLGAISDFLREPDRPNGDGFIVAPDGSRAGMVWKLDPQAYIFEMVEPTERRWGVWQIGFPYPMDGVANARRNLESVVPMLRKVWRSWASEAASDGPSEQQPS